MHTHVYIFLYIQDVGYAMLIYHYVRWQLVAYQKSIGKELTNFHNTLQGFDLTLIRLSQSQKGTSENKTEFAHLQTHIFSG